MPKMNLVHNKSLHLLHSERAIYLTILNSTKSRQNFQKPWLYNVKPNLQLSILPPKSSSGKNLFRSNFYRYLKIWLLMETLLKMLFAASINTLRDYFEIENVLVNRYPLIWLTFFNSYQSKKFKKMIDFFLLTIPLM